MRIVRPLNDKQIRTKIKRVKDEAPDKPVTLWHGGGLYLLIKPNGSNLWRLQFTFAGKKRLMGLGEYPVVTLAAATDKANALRALIAAGVDPVAQQQEQAAQRESKPEPSRTSLTSGTPPSRAVIARQTGKKFCGCCASLANPLAQCRS